MKKYGVLLSSLPLLFLGTIGCSPAGSAGLSSTQSATRSGANGSSGSGGSDVLIPTGPIGGGGSNGGSSTNTDLCASLGGAFNEGSGCADPTAGLAGNIFVLEEGNQTGGEIKISYILAHGARLSQRIQMTDFNVGARSFTEGFPLQDGSLLKGPNGQPVTAWFAFDLGGTITLRPPYASGLYQIGFFVDDGAILSIDGREVLNWDGYHSPQWACASAPVSLNLGETHSLRFQYFQGPPTEIAMRLLIRPYDPNLPCNETGGFQPIPAAFLSH